jgi:hypothetical protein
MISLRQAMAGEGVDLSEDVSVLKRLFGFITSRVPKDPDTSVTASVSVRQMIDDHDVDHIHLNVIRVGLDIVSSDSDEWLPRLDYGVYRMQNIFRPHGIGIRSMHWLIPWSPENDFDVIDSESEAKDLWRSYSVDNDGIDAFVVINILRRADLSGVAPHGDCEKGTRNDGLLAGYIDRDDEGFARTFAHEIGHFLGLDHTHGKNNCPDTDAERRNLMTQSDCVPLIPGTSSRDVRNSVRLTADQVATMKRHCSIRRH